MKVKINNLARPFVIRLEDDLSGIISLRGTLLKIDDITINILKLLDEGMKLDNIVKYLLGIYDVQEIQLRSDVIELVNDMLSIGIIDDNIIQKLELV